MSISFLPIVVAAMVGMCVVFMGLALQSLRSTTQMQTRLDDYLVGEYDQQMNVLDLELSESFSKRVIFPILRRVINILAWMWPKNRLEDLQHRLLLAGKPGRLTSSDFIGLKGWSMVLTIATIGLIGFFSDYPRTPYSLGLWILIGICSFFVPDYWLARRIRKRQREITLSLPDTLDMLVVALEAGLSFENAVLEIANRWRNSLSLEMLHVQRDIGMGLSRRQALLDLNYRTGVQDIASFVSAINQAEELGISISRVLVVQAEEIRIKRRQRAQEQANKAPIKMLFPMVFLIFPALFAVLLGPAIPELMRALGSL